VLKENPLFVGLGDCSYGIKENMVKPLDTPKYELYDAHTLLNQLMGDEVLAGTIINVFLDDMPHQIDLLKEFVDQGKPEQAGAQAHKIKGAMANIGSPALQKTTHAMEKAGRANDIATLIQLVPTLERQFIELRQILERGQD